MTGYWALISDGKLGAERTNKSTNRLSLTKTLSLTLKPITSKNHTSTYTKKLNSHVAISYQINEKTYCYSHDANKHTWHIQELLEGGKFGKETSHGTLENPYHVLFTFKIYNKNYLYAQNSISHYWYIQELLEGGKLGKETSHGTWKTTYHVTFPFRTSDGRIYHYGHNVKTNDWSIHELMPGGKIGKETANGTCAQPHHVAFAFNINDKTYYYGHNVVRRYWFIRELFDGGKMGPETAHGYLKQPFHVATSFQANDKLYYYTQNLDSKFWYIQELLPGALSFDLSSDNDDSPYHFTVTSDYLKKLSLKNDDDDTNPSSKSTSNTSYNFDNGTCSSSQKKKKEKECMICVESRSVRHFPKITKYCSHPNDICKLCVSKHIETQLNSKGDIEGILCPFGDSCGFLIEYNDVQSIVNSSLFEQYDSLSLKQALRSMPDFRWCKNAGCGSGQIHSGGDKEPIMTCEACGEKSCYTHDIPWHDNLSCEEYNEAKQGEDMATQDLLNRETKQCPKCGVRITKNGGCNHMTCKVQNCRYEFCWL
ncbi:7607_t:CDS:2 [Funneliformis caledonium]|uniref:RBR-type E3 ubiquitin transferase n=1 Tax=Funneliformis caledonium TaxID=1117310 RepID=A0A9N8YXP9_9GLOM|nr:7607_t:CDS:2 [Funneliformis caledonium]